MPSKKKSTSKQRAPQKKRTPSKKRNQKKITIKRSLKNCAEEQLPLLDLRIDDTPDLLQEVLREQKEARTMAPQKAAKSKSPKKAADPIQKAVPKKKQRLQEEIPENPAAKKPLTTYQMFM